MIIKGIYILVFGLLLILGSFTLLYPFYEVLKSKRKYHKVKAVCVSVNISQTNDYDNEVGRATIYEPVWEYYYDSQKYTSSMDSSDSYTNVPVGTEKIIYVNPENPLDIYIYFAGKLVVTSILGLLFLTIALGILVCAILQEN